MEQENYDTVLFLKQLQDLIDERKIELPEGSYTTKLFNKGLNKIAQKVGEEAVEVIIEAKDNDKSLFLNEVADLFYHLLVLLSAKDCRVEDVVNVLKSRHGK
jgi:phosphoribosyl-AMP cyclohydrolase / phosphoribosyl-ATP pyrophosphohydrolase